MQPLKRNISIANTNAIQFNSNLIGNLFQKPIILSTPTPPPTPPADEPFVSQKTKERILYERNKPEESLDFFIINTREVAEGLICDNPVRFKKIKFLVDETDTVTVWVNNKCVSNCDKILIEKTIGERYNFKYFLISLELEFNLMQHGKPQLVEIKKNRTVLFSKIVRIDDALPPVVNLASFINYIKPNQIKFEAYFANSFCNKKLFRIFINNEEIDFTYTISNNIVTANFNNNININTVEVYVYNSKGDYVFEKIEL